MSFGFHQTQICVVSRFNTSKMYKNVPHDRWTITIDHAFIQQQFNNGPKMKKKMKILGEEAQFLELKSLNFWLRTKFKSLASSPRDSFLLQHHETYIDKVQFYGCISNPMKSRIQNLLDSKNSNSKKHTRLWQTCKDKKTYRMSLESMQICIFFFYLPLCVSPSPTCSIKQSSHISSLSPFLQSHILERERGRSERANKQKHRKTNKSS